jgi:hypothetical protein
MCSVEGQAVAAVHQHTLKLISASRERRCAGKWKRRRWIGWADLCRERKIEVECISGMDKLVTLGNW